MHAHQLFTKHSIELILNADANPMWNITLIASLHELRAMAWINAKQAERDGMTHTAARIHNDHMLLDTLTNITDPITITIEVTR